MDWDFWLRDFLIFGFFCVVFCVRIFIMFRFSRNNFHYVSFSTSNFSNMSRFYTSNFHYVSFFALNFHYFSLCLVLCAKIFSLCDFLKSLAVQQLRAIFSLIFHFYMRF
jgi:hypothetical protein